MSEATLSNCMYVSSAYGLKIASERPLLDPIHSNGEPDVTVWFGPIDSVSFEPDQGQNIWVELPFNLKFFIRNGCEIIVDVPPGIDFSLVRPHILGSGMAFVLRQRGFLVLHASCVAKGDEAIAFLGGSGWGKSTLASAFHQHGYRLITDDVMAIQMDTSIPQVWPSFPEVKLLPDAADVLQVSDRTALPQPLGYKQTQRLDAQFTTQPVSLKQVYVLRLGEQHQIEPMSRSQSFVELIQHSRAIKTLRDPSVMVQHFHQCSELVKVVPMGYLKRPRSLEQLSQAIQRVEDHLGYLSSSDRR
jgi:hypothetical protein